nr:hypothetical protein [Tanacetum cinerariifolium]
MDKFCSICCFESGNAFIDDLIANSFDDLLNSSDHPPQHQTHSIESNGDPPQIPFISNPDFDNNFLQTYQFLCCTCCGEKRRRRDSTFYNDDDDDEYSIQVSEFLKKSPIAITPVLPTEEPNNSLSIGDEHLDTIPETKSDEVIKFSVEDLVPILSESEGILENMCDVPFSDKNHFDAESDLIESFLTRDTSIVYSLKIDSFLEEFASELVHIDPILPGIDETDSDPKDAIRFIEQLLYDDTSRENDSFEDIDYVEASPPDSQLVSLEEVKDEILHAKLLNIHLLLTKIESLNNNPTPDCVLKSPSSSFLSYNDNSLPEFETFSYHMEETSSGSTTTHANNSLFEYESFLFEIEPNQGELTSVVMNDISDNSKNDPFMETVDLFFALDNSIPPGIENVGYDSKGY